MDICLERALERQQHRLRRVLKGATNPHPTQRAARVIFDAKISELNAFITLNTTEGRIQTQALTKLDELVFWMSSAFATDTAALDESER